MAVRLRLRREGKRKAPHYRVVAADKRSPRNGKFIEIIGEYHPLDEPSTIEIDHERALHWLRNGAQPSSQVKKLLRIVGVWAEFKPGDEPERDRTKQAVERAQKARAKEQAEEAAEEEEAPATAAEEKAPEVTDETPEAKTSEDSEDTEDAAGDAADETDGDETDADETEEDES